MRLKPSKHLDIAEAYMSPPIRCRDGQGGNCCGIGPRQNGVSNIFHDARLLRSHGFATPTTREMGNLEHMSGSYIVAGARTPIGKLSGALAGFSAAELGGIAIAEALARAGVKPEEVEHVLMGQVLMAGQGQVPSRQAAVKA